MSRRVPQRRQKRSSNNETLRRDICKQNAWIGQGGDDRDGQWEEQNRCALVPSWRLSTYDRRDLSAVGARMRRSPQKHLPHPANSASATFPTCTEDFPVFRSCLLMHSSHGPMGVSVTTFYRPVNGRFTLRQVCTFNLAALEHLLARQRGRRNQVKCNFL